MGRAGMEHKQRCTCERSYQALVEEAVNLKGIWKRVKNMTLCFPNSVFFVIMCHVFANRRCIYTLDSNQR